MILCVATYSLFFSFLWLSKEKRVNRLFDSDGFTTNPVLLILFHIGGILIFGFTPILSGHEITYLPIQQIAWIMILVTTGLVGICIMTSYYLALKKFKQFPTTGSLKVPGTFLIITYFIVRIL